jgi:FMN phosphatase YigB (HAD superfamily)
LIKNIIFDLGNVLVGVDFERLKKRILSEGVSEQKYEKFFGKNIKIKYETGKINTAVFMDLAFLALGRKIPKAKLKSLFVDMFYEMPDMKRFIIKLSESKKYRLLGLSNTNSLHFNYCKKKFEYINLVDKFILSYKLKMVKPGAEIFKTVLKKYALNPHETIFIDDLKDNCEKAKKFRIHTICFKNYLSFLKQFKNIISKV